jgi:hypothetical protein
MGRTGLKLTPKEPTIFFKELKLRLKVLFKNKNHTKPVYRTWYQGGTLVTLLWKGFSNGWCMGECWVK